MFPTTELRSCSCTFSLQREEFSPGRQRGWICTEIDDDTLCWIGVCQTNAIDVIFLSPCLSVFTLIIIIATDRRTITTAGLPKNTDHITFWCKWMRIAPIATDLKRNRDSIPLAVNWNSPRIKHNLWVNCYWKPKSKWTRYFFCCRCQTLLHNMLLLIRFHLRQSISRRKCMLLVNRIRAMSAVLKKNLDAMADYVKGGFGWNVVKFFRSVFPYLKEVLFGWMQ